MAWLEQSLILQRNMERPKNICKILYNYFLYFKTKIQNEPFWTNIGWDESQLSPHVPPGPHSAGYLNASRPI